MRASLTAVAVVVPALFVGCSQPVAPTGPTSLSPASPSIASSHANATGAGLLSQGKEVPFKGRWEGALTARTPVRPGFLSISFEGTGNATHLGRFTVEIRIVLNTTNRTLTGTYEFTAANGDTLTASFTGHSPLTPRAFRRAVWSRRPLPGGRGGSPAPVGTSLPSACSTLRPA